jgi:hypothetical protein
MLDASRFVAAAKRPELLDRTGVSVTSSRISLDAYAICRLVG